MVLDFLRTKREHDIGASGRNPGAAPMLISSPPPGIAALAAIAILFSAGIPAVADSIPLPTVDYQATATVYGGGNLISRHSNGKMRVEMQLPGVPQATVTIIDLRARKTVTMVAVPGMGNMAMEADFSDESKYGVAVGQGRRVGSATVAGESCELWETEATDKQGRKHSAVSCVTRDSIALRVEATVRGKRETVFEITALKRERQDPKLFVLPADAQMMKLPKELRNLLRQ